MAQTRATNRIPLFVSMGEHRGDPVFPPQGEVKETWSVIQTLYWVESAQMLRVPKRGSRRMSSRCPAREGNL